MPSLKHPRRLGECLNPSQLMKANCNYFLFINREDKEKVKTYLLETKMSPDSSVLITSKTKKMGKLGLSDSRVDSSLLDDTLVPIIMRTGARLCPNVSKTYFSEQFEASDVVFISFKREPKSYDFRKKSFIEEICALAFCKLTKGMFVSLICSKAGVRLGGPLLKYIESYAKKNKIRQVSLDSLELPLGFYLYKDYKLKSGDSDYNLYEEDLEEEPPDEIMNQDFLDTIATPKQGYVHEGKWILIRNSRSLDIPHYPVSDCDSASSATHETNYTWITKMPGYIQQFQRVQTKNTLLEDADNEWETVEVYYKENIELLPDNRIKIAKENVDFNGEDRKSSKVLYKQSRTMKPFSVPNFGGFITKFVNVSVNDVDNTVRMSKIVSTLVSKKSTMTRRSTTLSSKKK